MNATVKQTIEIERHRMGFDELDFVARAVTDDETRRSMQFMRVEHPDGEPPIAIATDGRRLHYWQSEKLTLEPGAYKVEKRQKTKLTLSKIDDATAGKFVDWRNVIPNADELGPDTVEYAIGGGNRDAQLATVGREYAKIVEKWGSAFNISFLLDLAGFSFTVRAHRFPTKQETEKEREAQERKPDRWAPSIMPASKAHVFDNEYHQVHAVIMPMMPDK